ncbi:hypothetical protein C1646_770276 [Rhizophagus diaphanus]|nr:hypothetical protein C1646_770276 [Rhizophagus diaphanus] [Rhizophagus sp. MUCL 43196]
MNEYLYKNIPFNDIPHDEFSAIKICKGLRPTISKDILTKWDDEIIDVKDSEDAKDSKNGQNENKSKSFQTHPQAFYTSRLLNFKNLPKPVNSSNLSSFQFSSNTNYTAQLTSANPKLNEICQDSEHNIE